MTKEYFIILFFLVTLSSCKTDDNQIKTKDSPFLTLYKDTTLNKLYVYPDTLISNNNYEFSGKQFDSLMFKFFPEKITKPISGTDGFYGTYSFKFNESIIGLITRVPGEFHSTRISLWLYDLDKGKIINNILLADIYSYEETHETINSYLFKDSTGNLNLLQYKHTNYINYGDDYENQSVGDFKKYYLLKISNNAVDTISKDSIMLNHKFNSQLKKMASY